MTTIIKILLVLLVLTACFNASRVAMTNYQFEDAVHEGLVFNGRARDAEIVKMITKLASDYGIPLDPENISIKQVGQDVHVEMSYTTSVALLPGFFASDWTFTPSASTKILTGTRIP